MGLGSAAAAWVAVGLIALNLSASERLMSPRDDAPTAPKFIPLPGKAIGVVVTDAQEVLRREGRFGPPDAACFASGEASYRWFYVPARGVQGEPMTFGLGESGGESRVFDNLVLATPRTLKPLSMTAPYALVEVEVNGGRGSPAEESFAATKFRVLDGSGGYKINVADAIRTLRKRYEDDRGARKGLDAEFEKVGKQALKGRKPTGPRERIDLLYVTWLPDREVLRVEFWTELRDGDYRTDRGVERIGQDNPRSDVPPPEKESPRDAGIRHGTSFGIVTGMLYEVSKDGVIGPGRPLTTLPFVRELPPPGGAPP